MLNNNLKYPVYCVCFLRLYDDALRTFEAARAWHSKLFDCQNKLTRTEPTHTSKTVQDEPAPIWGTLMWNYHARIQKVLSVVGRVVSSSENIVCLFFNF